MRLLDVGVERRGERRDGDGVRAVGWPVGKSTRGEVSAAEHEGRPVGAGPDRDARSQLEM